MKFWAEALRLLEGATPETEDEVWRHVSAIFDLLSIHEGEKAVIRACADKKLPGVDFLPAHIRAFVVSCDNDVSKMRSGIYAALKRYAPSENVAERAD